MGSHRNTYPSGAASASAAYRYAGDSYEAANLDLSSQGNEDGIWSNLFGLRGRGSVYGHHSTLYTARDLDLGLCHSHGRSLLTPNGDAGGFALLSETDLHGGLRGSELLNRSFPTDFDCTNGNTRVSLSQHMYSGGSSFNLLSGERDVCTYGRMPPTYMNSVNHKQQVERTPQTSLQISVRKRKKPSLDEIIRETWELHSLFRAGLAASSNLTESGTDNFLVSEKWHVPNQSSIANDLGCDWADNSLQKKPVFNETWHMASNGLVDSTSSWKEHDVSAIEREGAMMSKMVKDLHDVEQEQHASDLQRRTCDRVAGFMGNCSDGDSSDSDFLVDSDDEELSVVADSSCGAKSREEQAFEFFFQTFVDSKELQKLFSEQCHAGKFDCLVCSSIPGKPAKKFNGLISVIMHASKIIKTKKKQEHRGYARALCSAMGWDLCKLPTMACSTIPHPRCCIPSNEKEDIDVKRSIGASTATTPGEL
ncbi:hypothetical protein L7F22_022607 [Adiantum nelumboides]|nr:hypothetical protein [Adiantum nelumboides]